MTYYLKNGDSFRLTSKEDLDLHEHLPAGNYIVKVSQNNEFYLEQVEDFEIKGKLYGETRKYADRVLRTYHDREVSTGVMFTGEKGSGKTLLSKLICVDAAVQGIPTIIINAPYTGDTFNAFIQMIDQPCIILFDEFEKVYPLADQTQILTLLDGVFPSKKLFIITCNDSFRVDTNMKNRPGRIFYLIDFKSLDAAFIEEYCNDKLKNVSHIHQLCRLTSFFPRFNFDMLKALVEEMNRYDENPIDAIRMLNAKPDCDDRQQFSFILQHDNCIVKPEDLSDESWTGNPLSSYINIGFKEYEYDSDGNVADYNWIHAHFVPADIVSISDDGKLYHLTNENGDQLELKKNPQKVFDYHNFM